MEYDLSKIYDALTDGRTFEEAKSGEPVEMKGNIDGFFIPLGGKMTYLIRDVTGPELRIEYGDTVIEVGKKYVILYKFHEDMNVLVKFLDKCIIGVMDEY